MLKSILRPIITIWEKFFSWVEDISTIENSPYGLLRMSVHPYKGQPALLSDGTEVDPGDYIIEIHISNLTIARGEVGNIKVASDLQLLSLFRQEMSNLAHLAEKGKLDPRVKAIWGVTMLGPGLKRLGFELKPMEKGISSRFLIMWMNLLKWVFSPAEPKARSKNKSKRKGYQYWMSIEQLIKKYRGNS